MPFKSCRVDANQLTADGCRSTRDARFIARPNRKCKPEKEFPQKPACIRRPPSPGYRRVRRRRAGPAEQACQYCRTNKCVEFVTKNLPPGSTRFRPPSYEYGEILRALLAGGE